MFLKFYTQQEMKRLWDLHLKRESIQGICKCFHRPGRQKYNFPAGHLVIMVFWNAEEFVLSETCQQWTIARKTELRTWTNPRNLNFVQKTSARQLQCS